MNGTVVGEHRVVGGHTVVREGAGVRAGAGGRNAAAPAVLRLTRRGRAVLLGALVCGALGGGLTLGQNPSVASDAAVADRTYTWVVVEPGQTLWQIARRWEPQVDPRITIDRIRDLNALPGVDLQAGQRIALP